MTAPRASVVMSAYGDLRFLDDAVASILRQDVRDLELILVDDGAHDPRIAAWAERDERVRLVVSERNRGGAAAGNLGIAHARSDAIVRMDADDVADRARVARLLAELDRDPRLGMIGSAVTVIDEHGEPIGERVMPLSDVEIRWRILFHNPFYHPSVAFRRSSFDAAGPYREDEPFSYDHLLWHRMLDVGRARNLPEPLLHYRSHPHSLTARYAPTKPRTRTHAVREDRWRRIGLTYTLYDHELAARINRFLHGETLEREQRKAAYDVLLHVFAAFKEHVRPQDDGDRDDLVQVERRLLARMEAAPPGA